MRWIADKHGQLASTFNKPPIFCFPQSPTVSTALCSCCRFSADTLWICIIFGHGKVMESHDWQRGDTLFSALRLIIGSGRAFGLGTTSGPREAWKIAAKVVVYVIFLLFNDMMKTLKMSLSDMLPCDWLINSAIYFPFWLAPLGVCGTTRSQQPSIMCMFVYLQLFVYWVDSSEPRSLLRSVWDCETWGSLGLSFFILVIWGRPDGLFKSM